MSKKRTLRIGIASHAEIQRRTLDIAKGKLKPSGNDPKVWFTSHKELTRVFSDQNMMLIEIIRDHAPESVTELAELAGCERPNVHRALKLLMEFNVIELVEGNRGRKMPRLTYEDYTIAGSFGPSDANQTPFDTSPAKTRSNVRAA